jgi:hypothetical protein
MRGATRPQRVEKTSMEDSQELEEYKDENEYGQDKGKVS